MVHSYNDLIGETRLFPTKKIRVKEKKLGE